MRRLLLVPLLLLAACGDDAAEGTFTSYSPGEVVVEVTFDEPLRVGPVTWEVRVVNQTDEDLDLEFRTGQRADVTLTRGGEEVYRWSRALLFTQDLATVSVPAGAQEVFLLDEPGIDVDPGEYTLTATVTAAGRDLEVVRQVTVEPMRR